MYNVTEELRPAVQVRCSYECVNSERDAEPAALRTLGKVPPRAHFGSQLRNHVENDRSKREPVPLGVSGPESIQIRRYL